MGTSLSAASRVWFTLSHGIFNEIYFPDVDQACTRDLGLIVTDGRSFFSEEKRHTETTIVPLALGVPGFSVTSTCRHGRYRIEKEVIADPRRDVLLQQTRFRALLGAASDYRLFVLLAPHLGNRGAGNSAWVADAKGTLLLFASREDLALALACSTPWLQASVGFVGVSDGWQDLRRHGELTWRYTRAGNGNVALTAEVDLRAADGTCVLAVGFGRSPTEAAHQARASLARGFEVAREEYVRGWQAWQRSLINLPSPPAGGRDLFQTSAAVLRIHEAKRLAGGIVASLSIPWGFEKGDDDLGGYHLVWPRDLVEAAGGLLAAGALEDARRAVQYLQVTQEPDGHWPQNMWLDGTSFWTGVQLDETALPILLVDLARREKALDGDDLARLWPMVRRAAGFIICSGPVTPQDRWEEDPGYSPFTLAAAIAALLVAGDLAEEAREPSVATYLRETADAWNASVERWTYARGTELSRACGVEGYYVRVAPPEAPGAASPLEGFVPIKNQPPGSSAAPAAQIVSPDALALVRFGLRAADDPRIRATVEVIDRVLRCEMPGGPAWRRYTGDGYGEHPDGRPFDGTGVGRAWPLLTGERAHYELARGRRDVAEQLLTALAAFANEGGLLPEQMWDAPDVPERGLFFGRPSGAAMPLVWAHAEYLKLRRSLHEARVFDMPRQPVERYLLARTGSPYAIWRFNHKCRTMPAGRTLRLEVLAPAVVHWSTDAWRHAVDTPTRDTDLGVHVADLPTSSLTTGARIDFTLVWPQAGRWEGTDFAVLVE